MDQTKLLDFASQELRSFTKLHTKWNIYAVHSRNIDAIYISCSCIFIISKIPKILDRFSFG